MPPRKPKKVSTPNCGNCRFGVKPEKSSFSVSGIECHRYPPSQSGTQARPEQHPFPLVFEDKWCGEHKPKNKK